MPDTEPQSAVIGPDDVSLDDIFPAESYSDEAVIRVIVLNAFRAAWEQARDRVHGQSGPSLADVLEGADGEAYSHWLGSEELGIILRKSGHVYAGDKTGQVGIIENAIRTALHDSHVEIALAAVGLDIEVYTGFRPALGLGLWARFVHASPADAAEAHSRRAKDDLLT